MNLAELYYVGKVLQECATVGMRSVGESQLSTTEMMVAETLFAVGPCTIGAIAHRTGYAQSRVSTVVSALHARGLLMVQTDPRDRRRTIVALSDAALGEARRVSAQSARAVLEASFPMPAGSSWMAWWGRRSRCCGRSIPEDRTGWRWISCTERAAWMRICPGTPPGVPPGSRR